MDWTAVTGKENEVTFPKRGLSFSNSALSVNSQYRHPRPGGPGSLGTSITTTEISALAETLLQITLHTPTPILGVILLFEELIGRLCSPVKRCFVPHPIKGLLSWLEQQEQPRGSQPRDGQMAPVTSQLHEAPAVTVQLVPLSRAIRVPVCVPPAWPAHPRAFANHLPAPVLHPAPLPASQAHCTQEHQVLKSWPLHLVGYSPPGQRCLPTWARVSQGRSA